MSILIASVYVIAAAAIFTRSYLYILEDTSVCVRVAIFWPIYAIHWFVENAVIAIKGEK